MKGSRFARREVRLKPVVRTKPFSNGDSGKLSGCQPLSLAESSSRLLGPRLSDFEMPYSKTFRAGIPTNLDVMFLIIMRRRIAGNHRFRPPDGFNMERYEN